MKSIKDMFDSLIYHAEHWAGDQMTLAKILTDNQYEGTKEIEAEAMDRYIDMCSTLSDRIETVGRTNSKSHQEELNKLLQPVFDYMQSELHPHCTLIVTSTGGELVEGICGLKANRILD